MAVTADTVQVRLEANVSKYLSDLKSADVQSSKAFGQIASAATSAASAITREAVAAQQALRASGTATREQLAAAAATVQKARASETAARAEVARVTALRNEAAAQIAVGAAARASAGQVAASTAAVTQSMTGARSSFSGVAAQFQDIGVTAAMGMNPMIIALQQGTQLASQLQVAAAGGQGVFRSLATGIAGLINPISITTIATIALGTAAVQYFATLITDGKVSEEVLKRQEDAVRAVADRWGDAVPALRAYVDQLDRAERASEESTVREVLPSRIFQEARTELQGLFGDLNITIGQLQAMADEGASFDTLLDALVDLEEAMGNGTATSQDMERVTSALASVIQNGGLPAVQNFSTGWNGLTSAIRAAIGAVADFNAQTVNTDLTNAQNRAGWILEQRRLNTLTAEELSLHDEINRVKADYRRQFGEDIDDAQALTLATDNLAAAERRRAEAAALKTANKADSAADREAQAILDLIDALEYELETLYMTSREQAVSNALRQAGAAATLEQRAEIEALTGAIYDTREAQVRLNQSAQEWADTVQSATRGFIDDLVAGKSAAEAFSNVLSNIASKLLDIGLDNLFGKSGFNLFGAFGGGLPTRATGGPVYPGGPTLVGERGPELFIPSGPGKIVPNSQLNSGGSVVFAPQIDARGADAGAVARIEQSMQRLAAEIVPTIRKEIATGPKKGRR